MFKKILVANRGEIACRVMRTARSLGIATVAVYSEADADARHVRMADEAVCIGPAPARESYLVAERILQAARRSGAEAIHPGYGFLSENEDFAEACERAGIVFIGPPASAIRAMGSKSAAKALMERAGVPLTPGYHGEDQDPDLLAREAARIGYPVLIKASAGGGGKGMRRVDDPAEFAAALQSCKREALGAFGDERVLVEKYVLRPRHIEIQVFGDTHGRCVYLFERDCSVQRRHQKVLEEAPAPGMTPERRAAMGRAAVEAARAVGYVGAGTVEFIAHQDGSFYFMEMNTRLQVEHPVTEMITGLDLVEWQLRVAAGEPLPLQQDQLELRGHAIEARVYAEDPDRGFLPSTGRLLHLRPPEQGEHVRVDTGVEQGDEITPHYDPMIAKLIVHGADRAEALGRMRRALAEYRVVGVSNNVDFLARLVDTPSFAQADLDTGLIEREQARLFPEQAPPPDEVWLLAALAELTGRCARRGRTDGPAAGAPAAESPWGAADAWRLNGQGTRRLALRHGERTREITAEARGDAWLLRLDDAAGPGVQARVQPDARGDLRARLDDRHVHAAVLAAGERRHVFLDGRCTVLSLVDPLHAGGDFQQLEHSLRAPMPGKVVAVSVRAGETVDKGAPLLVLEAMKMEHTISAPRKGVVTALHYGVGDQVPDGAELLEFDLAD
ncbi:acetyl/propionyl/methylcrotonyl-CoA carboxylase subunit alpha [Thiomonas sp.]|jgi:3-methylcrotonyl-CoA carboxylase alpha subunit|uniref:acetyl/propionyl/methylcrotonyl-CoA carboxylase subunit alpha n=1 Tax=Thiomonas sp. TaxID=2047785 RepID=UPI002619EF71|nr:acetyl/propionyl/methylcrotonyl-CoA carboxylase subunit alpha [Thiomonas sp.]